MSKTLSAADVSAVSEASRIRPRIGITGSFGRGNYGDELYVKTYEHWFGGWSDLHLLAGLPDAEYLRHYADAHVDLVDAVVLGGGDLICPYLSRISSDFINPAYLRRPVHVAGVGVQLNRPDVDATVVKRWHDFLSNPAVASMSTRDADSRDWVEEHLGVSVPVTAHPDLVCALPLPAATPPDGPPILGIVTRHIKGAEDYSQLPEVAKRFIDRGWRVRHIIGGVGLHGKKDFENAQLVEIDGREFVYTDELDEISRAIGECSLVLSMKLHTTIVATMYGVPTICINPVGKARKFMNAVGRGDLVVAPLDPRLLSMITAEIPPPPAERVESLREGAASALKDLGQRIWDEFRAGSAIRERMLSEAPAWPS